MQYHFKIHKDKKGYWAECLELKGCITQGETQEALRKNMHEALNLYLDEPSDSRVIFPLPKERVNKSNVEAVLVEPSIAFAFLLRRSRLEQKWTQKTVAEKLKVGLFSYQRLENSKFANPTLSTVAKLKSIFPQLFLDFIFA